jgi:riboflavin kinase/FMN adenylyltransferase
MKIISLQRSFDKHLQGDSLASCIVAIGNFDGVHIGHQAILKKLVQEARARKIPSAVIVFEPLPREFFAKNKQELPARLTRLREKALLLKERAIDYLCVIHFTELFSKVSKTEFIQNILIKKLAVKKMIIGQDFHFGKNREGCVEDLLQAGKSVGFDVEVMPDFLLQNRRVSSTWVREGLAKDDLTLAEQLLGRSYSMIGRVAHGEKLGRVLGFPTANIELFRQKTPVHGIYAVRVHGVPRYPILNGVASVGERPTVGGARTLLEVYIFDFNEDIYGAELKVEFLHKLRNEEHYDSLELLKVQIEKDVINAKKLLS